MPGTPPTTPVFGLPRYSGADGADFPTDFNAAMDLLDTEGVTTTDSRLTGNRTPTDASVTIAKLASDTLALIEGDIWTPQIVNYDDVTSPPFGVDILGRISCRIGSGQVWHLLGVEHICKTVGGTPTILKVQTDHASHGTLVDVTGLTGITPAAGTTFTDDFLGTPILLADKDQIVVRASTSGNSLGVNLHVYIAKHRSS